MPVMQVSDRESHVLDMTRAISEEQLQMVERLLEKLTVHPAVPMAVIVPDPQYYANVIPLR
jgi:hypothetical protein